MSDLSVDISRLAVQVKAQMGQVFSIMAHSQTAVLMPEQTHTPSSNHALISVLMHIAA